ncbi:MAG: T9SS type A sorting domain-containing protein, partial [Bacteroidetes bacterium]|nr:T9SS type A sorting domain-containing protein [Bacteroidota bacterium]
NYRSIDGSQTWDLLDDTNPKFGGGFGIKGVYAKNSSIIYVMDYLGNPWKSINGGISWDTLLPEGAPWPEEAWIKKIYFSPHNHNVLFCIVREGSVSSIDRLYRTTNNGTTWENLGAFLGSSHGNELIFAFDPVDSARMYVSGYDNYINSLFFASYDFGETWSALSELSTTARMIIVNWKNNNIIYLFGYPYRSTDSGYNWERMMEELIIDELPYQPWLTAAAMNPLNPNTLYVSVIAWDAAIETPQPLGIYKTQDGGDNWDLMEGSQDIDLLISGFWSNLYYDSIKQNLFVGSRGGIYVYNSIVKVKNSRKYPINFELQQNYPNPFNPSTVIEYSIPPSILLTKGEKINIRSALFVNLKVFDILGKEVAVLVNEAQVPGNYKVTFTRNNLPSGIYFYKLEAGSSSIFRKMLLLK